MVRISRHVNLWKTTSLSFLWALSIKTGACATFPGALTLAAWTAYTLTWLLKSATFPDKRWDGEAKPVEKVVVRLREREGGGKGTRARLWRRTMKHKDRA